MQPYCFPAITPNQQRRVVTTIDVLQSARAWFEFPKKHGDKPRVVLQSIQFLVQMSGNVPQLSRFVGLQLNCRRRRRHQQRRRHAFSANVRDHQPHSSIWALNVIVIVASHHASRVHRAGDFKSSHLRVAPRKKQPLNFRGQLHFFQKCIPLMPGQFIQGVPLCHKPLQNRHHENESDERREIVQDASLKMVNWRTKKVMKENTENNEWIRQARRKQNRTERKRQYIKVAQRNVFHPVVGVSDATDRQDHHQECPPGGRFQGRDRFSRNAR